VPYPYAAPYPYNDSSDASVANGSFRSTRYVQPPRCNFQCERCVHYHGNCRCNLNIFIYAAGVDMSRRWGFEEGTICRHCGRTT